MRDYHKTHSWLTFVLDMSRFDSGLWLALGEAKSKCEHISGVPLKPRVANALHSLYLAKGIRATTAIEGNTLTEEEVGQRLEGRLSLPPSREYLGREVDNIQNALREVFNDLLGGQRAKLSVERIVRYNEMILSDLELEDGVVGGRIRDYRAGVAAYRGAPPADCEHLLAKMCEWLNAGLESEVIENRIVRGIVWAIVAHLYMAWIHPFGDGNGRTARLIEFEILLSSGLPTPAAHLLSNHYNLTRERYYRELDRASKSGGDMTRFIRYAVEGLVDGLADQLDDIRRQQWMTAWSEYVHECFGKLKSSPAQKRRRDLVLDLTGKEEIAVAEISGISTRLAAAYAGKTRKTLSRDLHELEKMGLIEYVGKSRVRATWRQILAFLPLTFAQRSS